DVQARRAVAAEPIVGQGKRCVIRMGVPDVHRHAGGEHRVGLVGRLGGLVGGGRFAIVARDARVGAGLFQPAGSTDGGFAVVVPFEGGGHDAFGEYAKG